VTIPSDALAKLQDMASKSKRERFVGFPATYVRRGDDTDPCSARLLRGSYLRLQVHMTLVMQATRPPHRLPRRPPGMLTTALALPSSTGPRRINNAMRTLENEKLIQHETGLRGKREVQLLNADGSGRPWEARGIRWIRVPLSFWSNGWVLILSGPAVAVMLATLERNGGSKHPDGEWIGGHRKLQYGLSTDTWTRGTQELKQKGLLRTTRVIDGDDDWYVRNRTRYLPQLAELDNSPDWSAFSGPLN
jgi:hypothetical protein